MNQPGTVNHPDELCIDRPSSHLMLLEAWDGLSAESQMRVLHIVTSNPIYEGLDLAEKALASPNAYVRYLVARSYWLRFSAKDKTRRAALVERVRHDPSPLVRFALDEHVFPDRFFDSEEAPEIFCRMPREQRLAHLRGHGVGRYFADVMRKAMELLMLPAELDEMAREFVAWLREEVSHRTLEYWRYGEQYEGLSGLWKAVGNLPAAYEDTATRLIDELPPVPVLEILSLSAHRLERFLRRKDVDGKLRATIILCKDEPGEDTPEHDEWKRVLREAARGHVDMSLEEFTGLLSDPTRMCAVGPTDARLPPVMMRAMNERLCWKYLDDGRVRRSHFRAHAEANILARSLLDDGVEKSGLSEDSEFREAYQRWLERDTQSRLWDLSELSEDEWRKAAREVCIYQFATMIAPWPDQRVPATVLPKELESAKTLAVTGDPWAAYVRLRDFFNTKEKFEALARFTEIPALVQDAESATPEPTVSETIHTAMQKQLDAIKLKLNILLWVVAALVVAKFLF